MKDKLKLGVVIVLLFAAHAGADDYRAKNNDEINILTVALGSEVSANNWAKSDLICFSIDGKNPSKKLVDVLRRRKLNVCSQGEWRRKLACGFSVWLEPVIFDSAEEARIRFQSTDLRQVNTGEVHFVTSLREGEYSVKKTGKAWSIVRYTPKEQPKK
jgi:hypothetical protein